MSGSERSEPPSVVPRVALRDAPRDARTEPGGRAHAPAIAGLLVLMNVLCEVGLDAELFDDSDLGLEPAEVLLFAPQHRFEDLP